MTSTIPYGLWPSNIDASLVASSSIRYSEPQFYQNHLIWSEGRPQEQGRSAIVALKLDDTEHPFDLLPSNFSARSKVHEYGGGAYVAAFNHLFFVNAEDQNLYRVSLGSDLAAPKCILNDPSSAFANVTADTTRQRLIMVREKQMPEGVTENAIIACSCTPNTKSTAMVLTSGHDFYSNPKVSPNGRYLSFLSWDHPNMPWDSTRLWLAEFLDNGQLSEPQCIAGASDNESLFQPQWFDNNTLFFVSDKSNWWNLYRFKLDDQTTHAVHPIDAECATPQWTFNMSTYAFCENHLIVSSSQNGQWRLAQINLKEHPSSFHWLENPCTTLAGLCSDGQKHFAFIGANTSQTPTIYYGQLGETAPHLALSTEHLPIPIKDLSLPKAIDIPGLNPEQTIYAFLYPPTHTQYHAPVTERPPCIVICHGGPTGATDTSLSWKIQYWTNRGFAVLDVNYRGSTGYGRRYRNALRLGWGMTDVEDLARAAQYLREKNLVHPERIAIRGSSAGGFTVLACLTDTSAFNAGVSLYGVADLEILATDTHKFESRYLDRLIGPYPQNQQDYIARSPIHKVQQIQCPVALYQGMIDKVVPPNQADKMYRALKTQGSPVVKIEYEKEAHGFRQADTIAHQLRTELAFYRQVFNLKSEEDERSILPIDNF